MAGVALQNVDGQAEFGQSGQFGVPEPVGVTELQQPALAVSDLNDLAELTEDSVVSAWRVGLVAAAVTVALHEQGPRWSSLQGRADPLLRLLNDCGDFTVDQDAVRGDVDLALGVSELDHFFVPGRLNGPSRDRGQAVVLAGADLTGATAGQYLQQDHPHCLRVVETCCKHLGSVAAGDVHLLVVGQAEQRQRAGDLREGVVVDVVPFVQGGRVRDAGDLT